MRSTADVVFGVAGQTLRHRVMSGRPTSATYSVFALDAGDDDTAEWSGTATVDPVATTLAAAAGVGQADPTALSLVSASSVTVGRRYLVSQHGRREWVRLIALDGVTAYAAAPLQNAYTAAATFVSCDLTAAVDATWVADEDHLGDPSDPDADYRVRWEILYGGATLVEYSFFDLARGAVGHGVTLDDVEARLWNVIADLPRDHRGDQGQRVIDAAWTDVQADLAAHRINDAALRDAALVDQLLLRRIRLQFAENGYFPRGLDPATALADARGEYQRYFERHIGAAPSVARVTTASGGVTKGRATRYWSK